MHVKFADDLPELSRVRVFAILVGSFSGLLRLGLLSDGLRRGSSVILLLGGANLGDSISTPESSARIAGRCTLDAGFLDPAREAGFFAAADGGFDARDAGLALGARDAGFAEPARDALDAGLDAALLAGLAAAFEAGFAYAI